MQPYSRKEAGVQEGRSGGAAARDTGEVAWGLQSGGHCWVIYHLYRQRVYGWLSTPLGVARYAGKQTTGATAFSWQLLK